MVYRKKYGRKRVKTSRRYRKGSSSKRIARVAKSVFNRYVETKEVRYTHSNVGSSNFSTVSYGSGAVVAGLFGAIAQGVGQATRIGNKVVARGVRIFFPLSAADTTNNLRIIIVSAKGGTPIQPSLTANFVSLVLSQASSGTTQWTAPVDTNRFRVHFDRSYFLTFDPTDGSTTAVKPRIKFMKTFVKVNRTILWDDGGNINNDIYMIAISDSAAIPNPGAIGGFVNVYYKDA